MGGEPESFQLEKMGPNIYVNVPDLKQIVVVNRATKEIKHWPLSGVEHNFPMALDEADHRLLVGVHVPPRLAVFDTVSGRLLWLLMKAVPSKVAKEEVTSTVREGIEPLEQVRTHSVC